MLDIISDLPNIVIDNILSHLPLRVAVRTSILSKKWRLHWTRVGNLLLDEEFRYDIERICHGQKDEMQASTYVRIVGNILLAHSGPIHKFVLHPYFDNNPDAINLWILAVSRHGVQDLTLHYDAYDYRCKVPSYVFQCTKLKHLSLGNVENPPHNFEGLSSLLSIDLDCNVISGDLLTHIFVNCPLLERLSLTYWGTNGSFVIDASKLKVLCLTCNRLSDFILKNTPNASTISLQFYGSYLENQRKCPDILDFFGAVPKLENFTLTGLVLEDWGVQDVPKMLPAPLESHLLHLTVKYWDMYSLAQVRSMLCLIKSSPKMQTLDIFSTSNPGSLPHVASYYLKSQLREAENLWRHKTLKVAGLMGMEPEILFIELILCCCPVLEKLYLTSMFSITPDAELKMMTNIIRFRRASTQAEIIYSKHKR